MVRRPILVNPPLLSCLSEGGGGDPSREVWHNKCLWYKNDYKTQGLKEQSHYRGVWEHAFQKILDFYIDFDAVW